MDSNPISIPNLCEWCGGVGTCRCGRCHGVYYCSREHQEQHWPIHQKVCKMQPRPVIQPSLNLSHNVTSCDISHNVPYSNISHTVPSNNMNHNIPSSTVSHNLLPSNMNNMLNMPSASNMPFPSSVSWNQSNISPHPNQGINHLPACSNLYSPSNSCIPVEKTLDFSTVCADEILSTLSNELSSSDNSFWNLIDSTGTQNVLDLDLCLGRGALNQMSESQNVSSSSDIPDSNASSLINDEDVNLIECAPLTDICKNVIHDLNAYGICVLDKFIGSKRGNLVLDEVKNLYSSGTFEKGKLVKTNARIPSEIIRSDLTTWVDGEEPYCQNIRYLMHKLDLIIAYCNKMPNNGQLSKYKLHRRTKAMVACYPGNGTHYKKHIDNPNKDGRCITCIYYLNKNWDEKKHGGILRMFPSARESDVAQISPVFDRMIFFWSDRRNPHEVLPAYAMRFAITVWYFDADEREAALKRIQEKVSSSN